MKTKLLLILLIFMFAKITGQNYYKIFFDGNPENVFVQNITQGKIVSLPGTDTLHLKLKGTSVRETGNANHKLTIYPNPMDQICSFDFNNQKPGKVIIQVFNSNGSLIHKYSNKLLQGIQHFQLSGVPSGVYVIDIKTTTRHYSGSFVSTDKSNTAFLLRNDSEPSEKSGENKNGKIYNITDIENTLLDFRNSVEMDFASGDQLVFVGYATGSENDTVYVSPTGDQAITFTFCVKPTQPSAISGVYNPCEGATGLIYFVNNVAGVTYTWSVPVSWTITSGQNTNSITVTAGVASGNISITPSNDCGNGTSNSFAVTTQAVPVTPTPGPHVPSQTQIVWNWNTAAGATGYKLNTVNNFATAIDNGTSTTWTQNGLTCNTAFKLYIWAYNGCGNSTSEQLSQTTLGCTSGCGSSVTFTYNDSTVTYNTVIGANGRCWLDRNLGATQVATSSSDAASYGDLFQWGRLDDGHQVRTSPTTTTLSNSDEPGHGNFITVQNYPYDWRSPQNPNLWQGVNAINNVCPDEYRLPTKAEWDTERMSWSSNNAAGAFASPLKLPVTGYRSDYSGTFYGAGNGYYWSSSVGSKFSWYLSFSSSDALIFDNERARGLAVRCIKD